jgi:hypothetical protein
MARDPPSLEVTVVGEGRADDSSKVDVASSDGLSREDLDCKLLFYLSSTPLFQLSSSCQADSMPSWSGRIAYLSLLDSLEASPDLLSTLIEGQMNPVIEIKRSLGHALGKMDSATKELSKLTEKACK